MKHHHKTDPPLQVVEFRLYLPRPHNGHETTVTAQGASEYRREAQWRDSETWGADEAQPGGLEPADWLHHVALCALQDEPTSQERYIFSITGGLGQQLDLF